MSSGRQRGFTYLTALLLVAVMGVGLAATGELWSQTRQREKETELAWIGNQYVQAIGIYYHRSPGTVKRYPQKLEDLIEDRRFLTTQRYLRRQYADPLTGKADWTLVPSPEGGIQGVRSRLGTASSDPAAADGRLVDRQFVYEPPTKAAGR